VTGNDKHKDKSVCLENGMLSEMKGLKTNNQEADVCITLVPYDNACRCE